MTSTSNPSPSEAVACDHDTCRCTVPKDAGVQRERLRFCSEGCADGRGCNHPGCTCAEPISLGAGA